MGVCPAPGNLLQLLQSLISWVQQNQKVLAHLSADSKSYQVCSSGLCLVPWLLQILYLSVSLVPSTGLARADAQQIFAQWKSIQIYQGRTWSCSCLVQRLALLRGHTFASPAVPFMWRAICKCNTLSFFPLGQSLSPRGRAAIYLVGELGIRSWACLPCPFLPCSWE